MVPMNDTNVALVELKQQSILRIKWPSNPYTFSSWVKYIFYVGRVLEIFVEVIQFYIFCAVLDTFLSLMENYVRTFAFN